MPLVLFETTYVLPDDPLFDHQPGWAEALTVDKETALVQATNFLDTLPYASYSLDPDQPLAWPRQGFAYYDVARGQWVQVSSGTVPRLLKQVTVSLALHYLRYPQATGRFEPEFDSITVGPISLTNANPDVDARPVPSFPSRLKLMISPLLQSGLGDEQWWRAN